MESESPASEVSDAVQESSDEASFTDNADNETEEVEEETNPQEYFDTEDDDEDDDVPLSECGKLLLNCLISRMSKECDED